jgi:hypothetical protein
MMATARAYRADRDILKIDMYFCVPLPDLLHIHECPVLQKLRTVRANPVRAREDFQEFSLSRAIR